eukprot:CAMPEP_0195305082 /NCGR_PEP_ID=MMETSP0707-20130614/35633_1 /TAXON_ID=33640 /ORGANISM="Asterionellopsis glacialis, Strain CCMP134" /LENGTH=301 /DNA_ID=CAMNT_0040369099 /DNA_START=450 /DNA_END=1355 /DNA_ORIENTATION=-
MADPSSSTSTRPSRKLWDTPPERNVGGGKCTVGKSGWFGNAGDGTHATIYYGYGVETIPGADTLEVLKTVENSVKQKVIHEVFPTLCGTKKGSPINYRRMSQVRSDQHNRALANQYGISGFHFIPDLGQERRSCSGNEENECAIYKGKIEAYGTKETDILDVVESHLSNADAGMIHPDIVRIFYERVDGYQENDIEIVVEKKETDNPSEAAKDIGISAATILGISFSIGSVLVALIALKVLRTKQIYHDSNNSHVSFDSSLSKGSYVKSSVGTREETLPSRMDSWSAGSGAMIPFEDVDLS